MKTLPDVTNAVIDEFVGAGRQFSAHDVTRAVRDKVNDPTEDYDIDGGHDKDGRWQDYLIDHSEVKRLVIERYEDGDLDRESNGAYFLYEGADVKVQTAPVVSQNNSNVPTTQAGTTAAPLTDREIEDLIYRYLYDNSQTDLYHVQGAICRSHSKNKPFILMAKLAEVCEKSSKIKVVFNNGAAMHMVVNIK